MEPEHRFGKQMRGRVAEHPEGIVVLRVARRQELDPLTVFEWQAKVARGAVHPHEHRLLGELGADRPGGVETGRAVRQLELGGIWEHDLHRE